MIVSKKSNMINLNSRPFNFTWFWLISGNLSKVLLPEQSNQMFTIDTINPLLVCLMIGENIIPYFKYLH